MNETVSEWIEKAEADFATAERELAVTSKPNFDAVCFHAQQAIEKLMKALIIHGGSSPSKTHRLLVLDQELGAVNPDWKADKDSLRMLSRAAVDFRYPGENADYDEAKEALEVARILSMRLFKLLGR